MKERSEPLGPPSGLLPVEPSLNEAYEAMSREQGRGLLKRCGHLSVLNIVSRGSTFQVICERDSFEPPKLLASPYFTGRCPKRCRLYQAPWRTKLSRWRRNQHPMIWFERQPWPVKVAVILAPLLALAILFHVVKDLIALGRIVYEIVHGK